MAIASVLDVIRDLIADAVGDTPPDLALRDIGIDALRAVLEGWTWLEACLTHRQEHADIPLGVEVAVAALQRLCELNGPWLNTAEPFLWTRPEPQERSYRQERAPVPGTAGRPGRWQEAAATVAAEGVPGFHQGGSSDYGTSS